jgi:hypothetical protein
MEKQDWLFASAFMISFLAMLYLLGSSITGYVTQTQFCDDGICTDFCRFNADCNYPYDVCCDEGGFGVCRPSALCGSLYMFSVASEGEIDMDNLPEVERPASFSYVTPLLLLFLLMAMLVIAILYYMGRSKRKKIVSKQASISAGATRARAARPARPAKIVRH